MKKLLLTITALLFSTLLLAQGSDMSKKVFALMNEARTNPAAFHAMYKTRIMAFNKDYAAKLPYCKPVPALMYDAALETMGAERVEKNILSPKYAGVNQTKICSMSSAFFYSAQEDPLYYVCDSYENVHNEDYIYYGIYFSPGKKGVAYNWAETCNKKKNPFSYTTPVDSSKVNFTLLNTGKNATYMTAAEKRMLLEINFVRVYPKVYAQIIGNYLNEQSKKYGGLYNDEYNSWLELKQILDTMPSLPPLQPDQCLYAVGQKHGLDCQQRGYFDHIGSDGKWPHERVQAGCPKFKDGSENGEGSSKLNPRISVINLLLDTGISSRGHRYNIINRRWKYGACFYYEDKVYKNYWVQTFSF